MNENVTDLTPHSLIPHSTRNPSASFVSVTFDLSLPTAYHLLFDPVLVFSCVSHCCQRLIPLPPVPASADSACPSEHCAFGTSGPACKETSPLRHTSIFGSCHPTPSRHPVVRAPLESQALSHDHRTNHPPGRLTNRYICAHLHLTPIRLGDLLTTSTPSRNRLE